MLQSVCCYVKLQFHWMVFISLLIATLYWKAFAGCLSCSLASLHINDDAEAVCLHGQANSFNSSLIYSGNPFLLSTIGSPRNNGKQTAQRRMQSPSD